MYSNIPDELKQLRQWVCSDESKLPLNPHKADVADVADPKTWGTFEEAVNSQFHPMIGFVLTKDDPYCIIDLDSPIDDEEKARHNLIVEHFKSYVEVSHSGEGVHIIIKADVPNGTKKDHVELYPHARFIRITGNLISESNEIKDYNDLANQMYLEMKPKQLNSNWLDQEAIMSDKDVVEMAINAENYVKYNQLCNGEWSQDEYKSQSEADLALLSMLAFYSKNNEQCKRLFRLSVLGQRDKAVRNDVYLDRTMHLIRSNEVPPVNMSMVDDLIKNIVPKVETAPAVIVDNPTQVQQEYNVELFPPGLIGEVAQYIFESSTRPVREISLAAAIGLVAGICSRTYNVSGTGLNQYIVLIATTGTGKETTHSGIERLISAVKNTVPTVDEFIGPASFASGQALVKHFSKKPCFISVLGEFGLTLQELCDSRSSPHQRMLKKSLLDLYGKSGFHQMLRPSVYSDSDKDTSLVQAPNLNILGESTPEAFFEGLDSSHIAEGLIPRFTLIEYKGKRPARNRTPVTEVPPALLQKLCDLAATALSTAANGTVAHVNAHTEALQLLDDFDVLADEKINTSTKDVSRQLWNRAHLKALKLAALVSVGQNFHTPVITPEAARWAIHMVQTDVVSMEERFESGDIGTGDHKAEAAIRKYVISYFAMAPNTRKNNKCPKPLIDNGKVIPWAYLRYKLRLLSPFKDDRRGAVESISRALDDLVKAEILCQIPPAEAKLKFNTNSPLYTLGTNWS